MDFHKITRITLWSVFGAIFTLSIYINYLYLAEHTNFFNNLQNNEISLENNEDKFIEGKISENGSDYINIIKDNKSEKIFIDNDTEISLSKINTDTISPDIVQVNISELIIGRYVVVTEKSESFNTNKIYAKKIQILFSNLISGKISEINTNTVKINATNPIDNQNIEYIINLSENTKYQQINSANNQEINNINLEYLRVGDNIDAIYQDDLNVNNNQKAYKIILYRN